MRGATPTLHCDAVDGFCGTWDVDYYEATASTVNGVTITAESRAPGWFTDDHADLCPRHAAELCPCGPGAPEHTHLRGGYALPTEEIA